MVLLQFAIVVLRYVFGISYIFLDESVLYMHATLFMLGAGYTLLADAHVRVDIFYGRFATRGRAAIDLAGAFGFLLPSLNVVAWFTWPSVRNTWAVDRKGGGAGKRGAVRVGLGGGRSNKKKK